MSIHIHSTVPVNEDDHDDISSSSEEDDDQTWDDWVSDSAPRYCRSLFDDKTLPSVEAILAYDKHAHNFDLNQACAKLCLYKFRFQTKQSLRTILSSLGRPWPDSFDKLYPTNCA